MWYGRMVDWVVVTGEDGEEAVRGGACGQCSGALRSGKSLSVNQSIIDGTIDDF